MSDNMLNMTLLKVHNCMYIVAEKKLKSVKLKPKVYRVTLLKSMAEQLK